MRFGAHLSTAGGLATALDRGARIGADAVQIFCQSPRMWRAAPVTDEAAAAYRAAQAAGPVRVTVVHALYLLNLASPDPALYERSRTALAHNLAVTDAIGAEGLIVHVGSHLGAGLDATLPRVVDALAAAVAAVPGETPILLENTAGAGGTIGRTFGELARIVDACPPAVAARIGLCLDTQHLWASGVDFSDPATLDALLDEIDAGLGLDRLRCLHINDSKVPLGANRDRHANLGEGLIGGRALGALLGHPRLQGRPAILEVPGPTGDGPTAADLTTARRLARNGRRRHRARDATAAVA